MFKENGAAFVEAALFQVFIIVLFFGTFDLMSVAKLALRAQQLAEMTARVGSVEEPDDGLPAASLPSDSQLYIGSSAYLPEWRIYASTSTTPVPLNAQEIKALNLGLGYSQSVLPNYRTVTGFSAADWKAAKKIPENEFVLLPLHYSDPAYPAAVKRVSYRCCIGANLVLGGLVNVCRNASMPSY